MSPGGLLSVGTGAWLPAGLWPVPPAAAVLPMAPPVPAPPAAAAAEGADRPEPPQAASAVISPARATAPPSRGLRGCLLLDMARFYREADEEKMNPPGAAAWGRPGSPPREPATRTGYRGHRPGLVARAPGISTRIITVPFLPP